MDNGEGPVRRAPPARGGSAVPFLEGDALVETDPARTRVPGQGDDLIPADHKLPGEGAPDKARSARDQDPLIRHKRLEKRTARGAGAPAGLSPLRFALRTGKDFGPMNVSRTGRAG